MKFSSVLSKWVLSLLTPSLPNYTFETNVFRIKSEKQTGTTTENYAGNFIEMVTLNNFIHRLENIEISFVECFRIANEVRVSQIDLMALSLRFWYVECCVSSKG